MQTNCLYILLRTSPTIELLKSIFILFHFRFDDRTNHWIVDKERLSRGPVVYQSQYLIQYKLHQAHSKVFPLIEQSRKVRKM